MIGEYLEGGETHLSQGIHSIHCDLQVTMAPDFHKIRTETLPHGSLWLWVGCILNAFPESRPHNARPHHVVMARLHDLGEQKHARIRLP